MKTVGQSHQSDLLSLDVDDVIAIAGASALTTTARQELMELAKKLRTAADSIDAIVAPKAKKAIDENGEPSFRFGAKVALPEDFKLTLKLTKYALDHHFDMIQQAKLLEEFTSYYRKTGRKWQDWGRVWMDWVRREADRRSTAPKTRLTSSGMQRW